MPHYIALIHKDANSAYGVTFPDLPGCFSAADAEADIIPNAMEALELWFEDSEVQPEPSGIDALRADPEIAADLTEGTYLMAIPYRHNRGKSQRINITLNKGLLELIDEEASRRKMTRSALLAQAAEREVLG
ncbi:MAG: type II toxin-antitoxin system HicB family antitoxin [Rhizobiaceae bacterium]